MSTHDDDEVVIRANNFIAGKPPQEGGIELVRDLLNRIGDKKVEMRGLEGQVKTLQERVAWLEINWTNPNDE